MNPEDRITVVCLAGETHADELLNNTVHGTTVYALQEPQGQFVATPKRQYATVSTQSLQPANLTYSAPCCLPIA